MIAVFGQDVLSPIGSYLVVTYKPVSSFVNVLIEESALDIGWRCCLELLFT